MNKMQRIVSILVYCFVIGSLIYFISTFDMNGPNLNDEVYSKLTEELEISIFNGEIPVINTIEIIERKDSGLVTAFSGQMTTDIKNVRFLVVLEKFPLLNKYRYVSGILVDYSNERDFSTTYGLKEYNCILLSDQYNIIIDKKWRLGFILSNILVSVCIALWIKHLKRQQLE